MNRKLVTAIIVTIMVAVLLVGATTSASAMEEMPDCVMPADCAMTPQMMISDIREWTSDLPEGVNQQIARILLKLSEEELMTLHHELHCAGLLDEAPGEILARVQELAR